MAPFPLHPVIFVFDILKLNGKDMMKKKLQDRREILKSLLSRIPEGTPIKLMPGIVIEGGEDVKKRLEEALAMLSQIPGSEGLMLKPLRSQYKSGRSKEWAKFRGTFFVEARVLQVIPVKDRADSFTYRYELSDFANEKIMNDTTLVTTILAEVGDVLQLEVDEIENTADGLRVHAPRVNKTS